jgi:peptidoglycan L-alanyl-D-glutamate endopeptidase CwlK
MAKAPSGKPPLKIGIADRAADVKALQRLLAAAGFNPGSIDGQFGNGTQAAVIAFQRSAGLLADGIAGPRTIAALTGAKPAPLESVIASGKVSTATVAQMFPHTPLGNIKANLPHVLDALSTAKLHDRLMVIMALATIRAETESFEPVAEGVSRYNTSPNANGHPFDLYDRRADLGNQGGRDGWRFRGRGYVQLTGRFNYQKYGERIGKNLIKNPDLACKPQVAAQLLALFLADRERAIKEALLDWDFRGARRLVNGGSHGLERFTEAYKTGIALTA